MRSLLFAVVVFGAMPPVLPGIQAQEPEDTPLFLGSRVRVDDHPNDVSEYKLYAPRTSEICAPENMGNSCGRVWWNSRQQPVLGKQYVTQVPAMVRLRGPGKDAWWIPFVHCMVEDTDRKRRSTSPPGAQCVTMLKRQEERMEWAIGGVAEGIDLAVPGTYTGIIPLTVTGPGTRWELDIPVTYTVHMRRKSCGLRYNTAEKDFVFDEEFPGFTGEKTKVFSFQIRSLLPRDPISWTVTVNTPESSDDNFTLAGVAAPASGSASDESENVTVTFTGSDFENLPPGRYTRNWEILITCSQ